MGIVLIRGWFYRAFLVGIFTSLFMMSCCLGVVELNPRWMIEADDILSDLQLGDNGGITVWDVDLDGEMEILFLAFREGRLVCLGPGNCSGSYSTSSKESARISRLRSLPYEATATIL